VNDANKLGKLKVTESKILKQQYMASCDCGCKAQTESSSGEKKKEVYV
jgi:hypothetical protein